MPVDFRARRWEILLARARRLARRSLLGDESATRALHKLPIGVVAKALLEEGEAS